MKIEGHGESLLRYAVAMPRYAIGVLMIVIAILINIEVALRFFFNLPIDALSELILLLFPWLSLLGAAVAIDTAGANVTLQLLDPYLGQRARALVRAFVGLCAFVFSTFLVSQGWKYADMTSGELTNVLAISMSWDTAAFPVTGVLFALYSLWSVVKALRGREQVPPGPAPEPF
jgi:TRAP-type C4-dicarboxylate transport system permease small subunit